MPLLWSERSHKKVLPLQSAGTAIYLYGNTIGQHRTNPCVSAVEPDFQSDTSEEDDHYKNLKHQYQTFDLQQQDRIQPARNQLSPTPTEDNNNFSASGKDKYENCCLSGFPSLQEKDAFLPP